MTKYNRKFYMKIWREWHGNKDKAHDVFGEYIEKNKCGEDMPGGWNLDHIWPENPPNAKHGSEDNDNFQPLAFINNRKKADLFKGKIMGHYFEIKKKRVGSDKNIVGDIYVDGEKMS